MPTPGNTSGLPSGIPPPPSGSVPLDELQSTTLSSIPPPPAGSIPVEEAPSGTSVADKPSVWDRVSRVFTESPLAHSLGSFFDPNEIRSEWQSAGPELRKNPAFALKHAPATSPEAWKAL